MSVGASDPAFPRLHGRPERGWVNDPNGLSWLDGRFHVFFQHNPASARHDAIAWGHASSADLAHWRQEPVALVARPGEEDEHGCWSGCVTMDDGVPTAVYSGVRADDGRSSVLLARGDPTMRAWQQGHEPAAGMPDAADITDVRDPFVFTFGGSRYALQGAGHRDGKPQVLVYACDDLTSWELLGAFLTSEDPVASTLTPAHVWECPNLVQLGDQWALIVSLWRRVDGEVVLDEVWYLLGDVALGEAGPVFLPASSGMLDTGPCFYAPQVLRHGDRALLWAWAREWGRSPSAIDAAGWAGALSFPRELSVVGDRLLSRPAAELAALRAEELDVTLNQPFVASAFEIVGGDGELTLHLLEGSEERLVATWRPAPEPLTEPRILVDGSMVEVFDGGGTGHTTRAYPSSAPARWVLRGPDSISPMRAWRLG